MTKDIYRMSCILRETVPKNVHLLSATSLSCNSKAFSNCNVRWHCFKMQSRGTTKTFPNYLSQSFRKMFLLWSKFHSHPATRRHRNLNDVSLYLPLTSQVCLKRSTQPRLAKTSQWYVCTTSYWNVVTTSQEDVPWVRLRQVSNETPNDVSVVSHQKVSVVHIYDVLLARLFVVSCNSKLKHPLMLLSYISITYQNYNVAMHC